MDAPVIEHRHHHRAEFLKCVLPDAIEQFRPGHVTHADALNFLLLFRREVERIAQKHIHVPVIAGVGIHDRIESFGESNFLHE